ncbi:MAG: hypothetical protein EBU66_04265 [Bacteroidetes bacterium]|nr:hypothetical protein [bacterium]NBP63882.1 hypothetical protein [Bacteroidota bacterium]
MASIGSITEFKGGGAIKRGAKTAPASKGAGVEKMDTISTNSQGRFRILFNDSTTVNITENSRLLVDDFVYDGGGKAKGKLGLRVALGTVRYASGSIAHGNPKGVNIRTPTATIAVRGTDFVMSVDEAGRSTVVLVPECYNELDITKQTAECPNGIIDVITAAGVVTLSQPFQATVVENSYAPPSPAVTINPLLKTLDNNVQIVPLETDDGQSLLTLARETLKKFTNPAKAAADDNKDPSAGTSDNVEQVTVAMLRPATPQELLDVYAEYNEGTKPAETVYTNVSPTFKKNVQVGWVYTRLSDDKQQAVTIWLEKSSEAQVVSVQNGLVDVYNFMDDKWTTSGTGRPQGNITVMQQTGQK